MTRGRTKSLAELYTQVTSMSQSTPVFNTSDSKKMHVASTILEASEDVASLVMGTKVGLVLKILYSPSIDLILAFLGEFSNRLWVQGIPFLRVHIINKVLSQPALSQTSSMNLDAPIIEEVDASSDESEFSSPESTHMSKLRDSPCSVSLIVMPVMMTNTTSMEEQVSIMAKTLEELMKSITEREAKRDAQMSFVMSKIENVPKSNHTEGDLKKEVHREEAENSKNDETPKFLQFSLDRSISSSQLKEFIKDAIKDQVGSMSQSSICYVKPYTQRIDLIRMPTNYQPPIFQQFDGKGNLRQHVAHFIETCNIAGTYRDHMLGTTGARISKSFYNTRRIVSMVELTNSKQWKKEPVIDYIQRWRNLSLNCKDQLSETSWDRDVHSRNALGLKLHFARNKTKNH
uniref:Retrotransposon gag domain-containing protein n=1 Tax=Fagus sylvatica TaxID=28930 RepID=A0A2N9IVU3_FAGSY